MRQGCRWLLALSSNVSARRRRLPSAARTWRRHRIDPGEHLNLIASALRRRRLFRKMLRTILSTVVSFDDFDGTRRCERVQTVGFEPDLFGVCIQHHVNFEIARNWCVESFSMKRLFADLL